MQRAKFPKGLFFAKENLEDHGVAKGVRLTARCVTQPHTAGQWQGRFLLRQEQCSECAMANGRSGRLVGRGSLDELSQVGLKRLRFHNFLNEKGKAGELHLPWELLH